MIEELIREVDQYLLSHNEDVLSIVCDALNKVCRYQYYESKKTKLVKRLCQLDKQTEGYKIVNGLLCLTSSAETKEKILNVKEELKMIITAGNGEIACNSCVACLGIKNFYTAKYHRRRHYKIERFVKRDSKVCNSLG